MVVAAIINVAPVDRTGLAGEGEDPQTTAL